MVKKSFEEWSKYFNDEWESEYHKKKKKKKSKINKELFWE